MRIRSSKKQPIPKVNVLLRVIQGSKHCKGLGSSFTIHGEPGEEPVDLAVEVQLQINQALREFLGSDPNRNY